ncbi:MAG: Uncharacterized protein FD123_3142 [Bacteroidetes bacterium]|nr:MAG: Uncharacterized protein FD123_3142 [Bacteroidota bacterium]
MKIFDFIFSVIGWLQIAVSPFLIGSAVGGVVYFSDPGTMRLVIGIVIAALGLVIGAVWATRVWKKRGTVEFLSRANRSSDTDPTE